VIEMEYILLHQSQQMPVQDTSSESNVGSLLSINRMAGHLSDLLLGRVERFMHTMSAFHHRWEAFESVLRSKIPLSTASCLGACPAMVFVAYNRNVGGDEYRPMCATVWLSRSVLVHEFVFVRSRRPRRGLRITAYTYPRGGADGWMYLKYIAS